MKKALKPYIFWLEELFLFWSKLSVDLSEFALLNELDDG